MLNPTLFVNLRKILRKFVNLRKILRKLPIGVNVTKNAIICNFLKKGLEYQIIYGYADFLLLNTTILDFKKVRT